MSEVEDQKQNSEKEDKKEEDKPNAQLKAPPFKKITEGIVKPKKDDNDFDELLKKIIEDI